MTVLESELDLGRTLERVLSGQRLSALEAQAALGGLIGPAPVSHKAGLLAALRTRGETAEELAGFAHGLLARAGGPIRFSRAPLVDTCGTGGDGAGSFNLSTATALLVAALGIPVAKHGNRSVSSRCGSADVVEALCVPLARTPGEAERELEACGFAFLFAPAFHPALGTLAALRRELGVRTVFNLLGPLVNPAALTHQLLGAATPESARLLAGALAGLGRRRAFVVHGQGFDEATPCGPFLRLSVIEGVVTEEELDPLQYGCPRARPEDLAGGDARENAARLEDLFGGREHGPLRDAVCLNAALVLQLVAVTSDPRDAFDRARAGLEDGCAAAFLQRLQRRGGDS